MSITLDLPEEISADILRRAEQAGKTPDAYVADSMRRQLAQGDLLERQQLDDIDWALAVRRERK